MKNIFLFFYFVMFVTSNIFCQQYQIYWGDVHTHTNLSDGKVSIDDLLTYARDTAKVDFIIVSDHDFGNGPPWQMSKDSWNFIKDKADEYTVNNKFVVFAGYEWTSAPKYWAEYKEGPSEKLYQGQPKYYNHKNVFFLSRVDYLFSAKNSMYMTPDLLAEAVMQAGGLIHNNHPSSKSSEDGRDQFNYSVSYYPTIVNTEMGNDIMYYNGRKYELNQEQTVKEFLNMGGKTGFIKGTDTHEGKPAALTAVFAEELSRKSIFEAFRSRRNYAISNPDAKIVLNFKINGHYPGEEIEINDKPEIIAEVNGTSAIKEITIIKDGSTVYAITPKKKTVKFSYTDNSFNKESYYYLKVIQVDTDKNGNPSCAWSSPIWVRKHLNE